MSSCVPALWTWRYPVACVSPGVGASIVRPSGGGAAQWMTLERQGTRGTRDMTDLKSSLQVVLQDAGYQTWLVSLDDLEAIGFEDEAAMGFAYVFEDAATMLTRWRELEIRLLTRHAPSLQKAGEKTWNIYSVFLCSELGTADQLREIRWIEEESRNELLKDHRLRLD